MCVRSVLSTGLLINKGGQIHGKQAKYDFQGGALYLASKDGKLKMDAEAYQLSVYTAGATSYTVEILNLEDGSASYAYRIGKAIFYHIRLKVVVGSSDVSGNRFMAKIASCQLRDRYMKSARYATDQTALWTSETAKTLIVATIESGASAAIQANWLAGTWSANSTIYYDFEGTFNQ